MKDCAESMATGETLVRLLSELRAAPAALEVVGRCFWSLRECIAQDLGREPDVLSTAAQMIELLFDRPFISHGDLSPLVLLALARRHPRWTDPGAWSVDPLIARLQTDRLFLGLLRRTVNTDLAVESVIRQIRRRLLHLACVNDSLEQTWVPLCAALAEQGFNNEYILGEDDSERDRLARLEQGFGSGGDVSEVAGVLTHLLAFGMYRPLVAIARAQDFAGLEASHWTEPVDSALTRLIVEPLKERRLLRSTPTVGRVAARPASRVQRQYETHPFPRWFGLTPARRDRGARPEWLHPGASWPFECHPADATVLVPGCGTGRHALLIATRSPGCSVLATDISQHSLAHARRMAEELRVSNVEFVQSDLRDLPELGRRFHHVDCVGVVHHLEDPAEGWTALEATLEHGGTLRLGLYSRVARLHVEMLRREIARRGIPPTHDAMVAFRDEVLSNPRFRPLVRALAVKDFFSTSGLRDFLFHACEHAYSITGVLDECDHHGFRFLGFDLPPPLRQKYLDRFPLDGGLESPATWRAFEAEYAGSATMLLFSLQKTVAR